MNLGPTALARMMKLLLPSAPVLPAVRCRLLAGTSVITIAARDDSESIRPWPGRPVGEDAPLTAP